MYLRWDAGLYSPAYDLNDPHKIYLKLVRSTLIHVNVCVPACVPGLNTNPLFQYNHSLLEDIVFADQTVYFL